MLAELRNYHFQQVVSCNKTGGAAPFYKSGGLKPLCPTLVNGEETVRGRVCTQRDRTLGEGGSEGVMEVGRDGGISTRCGDRKKWKGSRKEQ
jgi:hypothetical protein